MHGTYINIGISIFLRGRHDFILRDKLKFNFQCRTEYETPILPLGYNARVKI